MLSAGGRSDRTARLWLWRPDDLIAEACARVGRDLTQEEWTQYLPVPGRRISGDQRDRAKGAMTGAPSWDEAVAIYQRGDHLAAIGPISNVAEGGDPRAQNMVGHMLLHGEGTAVDVEAALGWFERAADQQHVMAQHNLGSVLGSGRHGVLDLARAKHWLHPAANQGYATSQMLLYQIFVAEGDDPRVVRRAIFWLRAAANRDFHDAQYLLGHAFAKGEGVSQSHATARLWWERATNRSGQITGRPARPLVATDLRASHPCRHVEPYVGRTGTRSVVGEGPFDSGQTRRALGVLGDSNILRDGELQFTQSVLHREFRHRSGRVLTRLQGRVMGCHRYDGIARRA